MKCPKCKSENVNIQMVTETKLKDKHHSFIWWLLIGWWLEIFLWFFLTIPKLLFTLFGHKKQKAVSIHKKIAICQNCGNSWRTY